MHLESWGAMPTQYIFRGLPQKDKGVIIQARSEIRSDFYNDDWFRVSVPIGFWVSAHPADKSQGVPNVPRAWYESRFDGGLILGFGGLEIDSRFTIYSSPNGSFEDVYEGTFVLSYDDEAHWAGDDPKAVWRGIQPHLTFARELIGARDGGVEGSYVEVGVQPTAHILEGGAILGANFSVPLDLGFSAGDYYEVPNADGELEDHTLGFISLGAVLDLEARFIPRRLGLWSGGLDFRAVLPLAADEAPSVPDADGNGVDTVEYVFFGYSQIAF